MDMGIRLISLPNWIVDNVLRLIAQIIAIRNPMSVIPLLPNLPGEILSHRKRKATLDELHTAFDRHIRRGCQKNMNMIRHNDEGMKQKLALIAVPKECRNKELSESGALEDAASLVGNGGKGVGLGFEAHWEGVSRGLKPLISRWPALPGLKSGPISEATTEAVTALKPH